MNYHELEVNLRKSRWGRRFAAVHDAEALVKETSTSEVEIADVVDKMESKVAEGKYLMRMIPG
jgi:hypothetical protein